MTEAPPKELIEKVIKLFQEKEQKQRDFIERYGYIRPPSVMKAWGKTFSILENGIYVRTREGPFNVPTIIHDHALLFFGGNEFLAIEESKPFEKRHQAIQWMHTCVDHRNKQLQQGIPENQVDQLGSGAAWLRFANDLYTIRDNAKLEARLKAKLLNPLDFQGARHELRVAALCIAAGFNIEFEDDTDNTSGHTEFIATDRFSSAKIAVEAKSRHRYGVLGFTRGSRNPIGSSVGIRGSVLGGYKKETDLPLYVFVDVNLPPMANEVQLQTWLAEIHDTMVKLADEGYANPCPANAVFFCNDPSHYRADKPLIDETDKLWISHYAATVPRIPHPSNDMVARILKGYNQRVASPDEVDSN